MQLIDYIGLPYESGGRGPEAFDCWGLVMHYTKETCGLVLPDQPIRPEKVMDVFRKFKEDADSNEWECLPEPEIGCVVACGKNACISHAGVLVEGNLVLHASRDANSVCLQGLIAFRRSWPLVKFYKYTPHDTDSDS